MSADSRVVARWKVNLSDDYEFLSMEKSSDGIWVAYEDHISLLAEAERLVAVASDKMHERDKELIRLTEKNDALQSRLELAQAKLDAVVGLVAERESILERFGSICDFEGHGMIYETTLTELLEQLRSAALGGELGNEEVG